MLYLNFKSFTIPEVFFVITGRIIPDKVLPIAYKGFNKNKILEFMAQEKLNPCQFERVRMECKTYLLCKFQFLFLWDLGDEVWNLPGALEFFFLNYATKFSFIFEIEPMICGVHAQIELTEEMNMIKKRGIIKKKIQRKMS